MGYHGHRHAIRRKAAHDLKDLTHDLWVERGGRLVEEHELGAHTEGTRDGHALLLPTRERRWCRVRKVGKAHLLEVLACHLLGLALAHLFERDGRERTVGEHVHVVEQVEGLETHAYSLAQPVYVDVLGREVLPLEPDVPGIGRLEQIDAAKERRLAGSRRADDGDDLTWHDLEVDVAQHLMRAK